MRNFPYPPGDGEGEERGGGREWGREEREKVHHLTRQE
jgi:hypothetical protein